MTVVFAGGEMEAFAVVAGSPGESTFAAGFDATYARCSILLSGGSGSIKTPPLGSLSTAWTHFDYYTDFVGNAGKTYCEWRNSVGTVVFRIVFASVANFKMQYWDGAAFQDLGSPFSFTASVRRSMDVKIVCGGSGSAEVYVNQALVASGSASMTAVTNIDEFRPLDNIGGSTSLFSQVIVATVPTVGWKYYLKPPTGNSATNTAWTGTFADVDETSLADADFISSSAAGDVETYTRAAIALGTGTVKAVVVSARAKNAAAGPQNLQAALRLGSTNYFSSNMPGIGIGFTPFVAVFENDPSTLVAWAAAAASSAATEFGVKSIA
jgi:hypothetical protein